MIGWEFFLTSSTDHDGFVQRYGELLSALTINGFGDARRSLFDAEGKCKLYKFLKRSDLVALLQDEKGKIFGFAFITIPEEKLFGQSLVWIDNVCLDSRIQGQGFGVINLLNEFRQKTAGENSGWTGCQTQHFGLMNSLYKASSGDIFPFAHSYGSDEGKQIRSFLTTNIEQLKELEIDDSGIRRMVFDDGRLGNDNSSARPEIENYLAPFNFSRNDGDSVIILARV